MVDPQHFSFFDGGFLSKIYRSVLMLLEEYSHAFLKKSDLVHEERDIELLCHFLATLVINLQSFPRNLDIEVL
jgi:hypothetical protein